MEKIAFYTFRLMTIGLFFLSGCKKDSKTKNNLTISNRISEVSIQIDSSDFSKHKYSYNDNKLVLDLLYIPDENGGWKVHNKTEIIYINDNLFKKINYYDIGTGNLELNKTENIIYENGLWKEYIKYNANGIEEEKNIYIYDNGLLIEKKHFIFQDGQYVIKELINPFWIDNLLSYVNIYWFKSDGTQNLIRDTITYSNGEISKIETIDYYDERTFVYKRNFFYTGNMLSSIVTYYNNSGSWTEILSQFYSYDNKGNLIKKEFLDTTKNEQVFYSYEENCGNISFVEGYFTDYFDFYYPFPTKSGSEILENSYHKILNTK